ncbi:MAG TPA: acyloxyacyl hydrolase [Acidobacteriaceae bacterium]|nr:acyloxyacyl hydrolase [Acidobacteriaceae bacterium]
MPRAPGASLHITTPIRNLSLASIALFALCNRPAKAQDSLVFAAKQTQQTTLKLPDFNQDIYYKNKLEASFESGWLQYNIPLVYDFLVGSAYTAYTLQYTLEPNILSLRWQRGDIKGPVVLRGNWDFTFSADYTDVVRGPETRYLAFDYGIRRNFIPRRWRATPYFEMRGGIGNINSKGYKVLYGQGQDLTFTYMMGAGWRYNFNPRYSLTAGLNYYHISNMFLSEPKLEDYGINVYGPMFGINVRLGKPKLHSPH